jgi:hypothetical protein
MECRASFRLSNFACAKRMLDVWQKEYSGTRPFAFVLEHQHHAAGGHNAPRNKSEFTKQNSIDNYFDKALAFGGAGLCRRCV